MADAPAPSLKTLLEKKQGRELRDDEAAGVLALNALAEDYARGAPPEQALVVLAGLLLKRQLLPDQAARHALFADVQKRRSAEPLEVVAVLARAAAAGGMVLPGWFRELELTPEIRERKQRIADEAKIETWRKQLCERPETAAFAASAPAEAPRRVRLRQVEPGLFRWESRASDTGVWARLSSDFLGQARALGPAAIELGLHARQVEALAAFLTDDERPVLALLFKYARGTFGYGDVSAAASRTAPANPLLDLLRSPSLARHVVDKDGRPMGVSPTRLVWDFRRMVTRPGYVFPRLAPPEGGEPPRPLVSVAPGLYAGPSLFFPGPAPIGEFDGSQETTPEFLEKTFESSEVLAALRRYGDRPPLAPADLPPPLRVHARIAWEFLPGDAPHPDRLLARLFAVDDAGHARAEWHGNDWVRLPASGDLTPGEPDTDALRAHRDAFRYAPGDTDLTGLKSIELSEFSLETISGWLRRLPAELVQNLPVTLLPLLRPADTASWRAEVRPVASGADWFDLRLIAAVEDATLTPAEVERLVAARGAWVRLGAKGWRRAELSVSPSTAAALTKLGLQPETLEAEPAKAAPLRFHALQLAGGVLDALAAPDAVTEVRRRLDRLAALPKPDLPADLAPGVSLRPYQHEGFHFLAHLSANGLAGILADDMGLGKTLQTLTWLLWLRERKRREQPDAPFRVLVVAPKSVVNNWISEAKKFAPSLKTALHDGVTAYEKRAAAHLLVVNYARLLLNADTFLGETWDAVILDEAQHIKTPTSGVTKVAHALRATHRLALSGTPVENRLTDLWSILQFAMPGLLGSLASFRRHYDEKKDKQCAARLGERVRPFLLRRTKRVVAQDLPERSEEDLVIDLEPAQRARYELELRATRALLLGANTTDAMNAVRFNVLQSLMRLRQICCDPRLVDPEAPESDSAKLDALLELLTPVLAEDRKILVFSQFTSALDLIAARLKREKIPYLLLTGATENRAALVERFQKPDTEKVFLLSLKAAGSGLTLTAASSVVLYDPWWNPAAEAQAIDRTHRIGQKNPVVAYRFLANNTIEQKIRALQRDKAALADQILDESDSAKLFDLDTLREILAG